MTFMCVIYNGKSKKSYRRMFQEVRFHIGADDISKSVADGFIRFRFFVYITYYVMQTSIQQHVE